MFKGVKERIYKQSVVLRLEVHMQKLKIQSKMVMKQYKMVVIKVD